jgi:hypothetical protein
VGSVALGIDAAGATMPLDRAPDEFYFPPRCQALKLIQTDERPDCVKRRHAAANGSAGALDLREERVSDLGFDIDQYTAIRLEFEMGWQVRESGIGNLIAVPLELENEMGIKLLVNRGTRELFLVQGGDLRHRRVTNLIRPGGTRRERTKARTEANGGDKCKSKKTSHLYRKYSTATLVPTGLNSLEAVVG